ncbi:MAG: hypothetical protein FJ405_14485 [Verrucomicrobia bacterium]|nr:hypothetical protein [Verrucomicrobiota bacterium]
MKSFVTFLLSLTLLSSSGATQNILVVVADDLGMDSLGLYNHEPAASLPPTPNIDSLAARGVRFTSAYAYPVCSPTRAAMMTGRYAFRTGVNDILSTPAQQGLFQQELTLPELLAPTHRTGSFGKWHLGGGATGPNIVGGWSHFAGSLGGALGMNATNFYLWSKTTNGSTRANHYGYATTDNINDSIQWLGQQGTNRWLLWLAFNAPHTPYHLPPAHLCPRYATLSGTATDIQRNPRRYFEASVEAMDTELGRLLASIDRQMTTVIFVGDNGTQQRVIQPPFNIAGRAKDSLYEGGVRVPLIIAGPDIVDPGRASSEIVHVVDVFATVVEFAGIKPTSALPARMPNDSRSLVPILRNEPWLPAETAILTEDGSSTPSGSLTGRAVRLGDYKLIRWDTNAEELYRLSVDPLESTNLLTQTLTPAAEDMLLELRHRLSEWTNRPDILSSSRSTSLFVVEIGWFANASLSLWRTGDPAGGVWTRVVDATTRVLGDVIRITDPDPPTSRAFYQVRNE